MLVALLLVSMGIWLVTAPVALNYTGSMAEPFSITVGAIIAASATLLLWPKLAPLRWISFGLGIILITSPVWMLGEEPSAIVNQLITGLFVIAFSLLITQGPKANEPHLTHSPTSYRFQPRKSLSK